MGFYSTIKKNEFLLFAGKWKWRTSSRMKLARFRKPKAMLSLICRIQTYYKYKQYYMCIQIYKEHVPTNRTGRGD
jgi:hypothetical protein